MADWFVGLNPIIQALLATLFTWGVTALGASLVFFFKPINRKVLDAMLGFAAGVMIAASFWSLRTPASEMSEEMGVPSWLPAVIGFLLGGVFLRGIDMVLPHLHLDKPIEEAEGVPTSWNRSVLLVLAITPHNIPEGLAEPWPTTCPPRPSRARLRWRSESAFRIFRRERLWRCRFAARGSCAVNVSGTASFPARWS